MSFPTVTASNGESRSLSAGSQYLSGQLLPEQALWLQQQAQALPQLAFPTHPALYGGYAPQLALQAAHMQNTLIANPQWPGFPAGLMAMQQAQLQSAMTMPAQSNPSLTQQASDLPGPAFLQYQPESRRFGEVTRQRAPKACLACRKDHKRCPGGLPCWMCVNRQKECKYNGEAAPADGSTPRSTSNRARPSSRADHRFQPYARAGADMRRSASSSTEGSVSSHVAPAMPMPMSMPYTQLQPPIFPANIVSNAVIDPFASVAPQLDVDTMDWSSQALFGLGIIPGLDGASQSTSIDLTSLDFLDVGQSLSEFAPALSEPEATLQSSSSGSNSTNALPVDPTTQDVPKPAELPTAPSQALTESLSLELREALSMIENPVPRTAFPDVITAFEDFAADFQASTTSDSISSSSSNMDSLFGSPSPPALSSGPTSAEPSACPSPAPGTQQSLELTESCSGLVASDSMLEAILEAELGELEIPDLDELFDPHAPLNVGCSLQGIPGGAVATQGEPSF